MKTMPKLLFILFACCTSATLASAQPDRFDGKYISGTQSSALGFTTELTLKRDSFLLEYTLLPRTTICRMTTRTMTADQDREAAMENISKEGSSRILLRGTWHLDNDPRFLRNGMEFTSPAPFNDDSTGSRTQKLSAKDGEKMMLIFSNGNRADAVLHNSTDGNSDIYLNFGIPVQLYLKKQ